ncbi:methanol dehydrogenase [Winogradskyella aurantia]|uniref:Methanol dehydrogenase n=2 Tax=Winogradskyella aurantia TaxID=1915063 RepID=A0A265UUV8_9FLAO|nr:methanol dehydrogenase [Winogradskyella aurantia]
MNKTLNSTTLIFLCALFFMSSQRVLAQFDIPKKPEFQTSVYDYINLFSPGEKKQLEEKLIRYSDTTSTQIVVAVISSTKGEYINYLGAQWAESWGIGQAKEDNGIFILLAKDDRKIGISTGKGIEYLLTDALSKRIITRDIIPYFKQGDYAGGLNRGVDAIFEVLNGEYQGTRKTSSQGFPLEVLFFLFIIFIILIIAISKSRGGGGRNGGNRSDSRSLLEAIILSNMGRGSYSRRSSGGFGGFGGSSGGGFGGGGFGGGFGGGSFGGGGASGGW